MRFYMIDIVYKIIDIRADFMHYLSGRDTAA